MKSRQTGCKQGVCAAKAGISVRTGRRIEKGEHQHIKERHWRTREDPLKEVWTSELLPLLQKESSLTGITLWDYLDERYPDQYPERLIDSIALSLTGIIGALSLMLLLAGKCFVSITVSVRLRRQFDFLSQQKEGYFVVDSTDPLVFTLGWWNPQVYISQGMRQLCNEQDLSIILAHENAHLRRRDNIRLLAAQLFTLFNPQTWSKTFLSDLHVVTEQACDFSAAKRFGPVEVAETLLKAQRILLKGPLSLPLDALAFIKADVESRIRALLNPGNRSVPSTWQLSFLSVSLSAFIVVMVGPLHHVSEWVISFISRL